MQHGVERDDWIVGGLALILLITVLLFPWYSVTAHDVSRTFLEPENRPAVQAPYAWAGLVAMAALIWLLLDLGIQRFRPDVKVPTLRDGRTMRFVLAVAAAVFLVFKLLLHPHNLGWGFFFAVIVAIVLLYAALQVSRGASPIPGR